MPEHSGHHLGMEVTGFENVLFPRGGPATVTLLSAGPYVAEYHVDGGRPGTPLITEYAHPATARLFLASRQNELRARPEGPPRTSYTTTVNLALDDGPRSAWRALRNGSAYEEFLTTWHGDALAALADPGLGAWQYLVVFRWLDVAATWSRTAKWWREKLLDGPHAVSGGTGEEFLLAPVPAPARLEAGPLAVSSVSMAVLEAIEVPPSTHELELLLAMTTPDMGDPHRRTLAVNAAHRMARRPR